MMIEGLFGKYSGKIIYLDEVKQFLSVGILCLGNKSKYNHIRIRSASDSDTLKIEVLHHIISEQSVMIHELGTATKKILQVIQPHEVAHGFPIFFIDIIVNITAGN